jgi:hypothetical protein
MSTVADPCAGTVTWSAASSNAAAGEAPESAERANVSAVPLVLVYVIFRVIGFGCLPGDQGTSPASTEPVAMTWSWK